MNKKTEQLLHKLHTHRARRKLGLSVCEGVRCCRELVKRRPELIRNVIVESEAAAKIDVQEFIELSRDKCPHIRYAEPKQFKALSQTENSQGVLVVFALPELVPVEKQPIDEFVLILDRIREPGNMGTILRTAASIGLKEVWLSKGSTEPFSPKAVRSGMGGQFLLDIRNVEDLATAATVLKKHDYGPLWLTVPRGGVSCYSSEFDLKACAVVIGNEANGVDTSVEGKTVSIPMPGNVESLNAAQAATLFLFESVRRSLKERVIKIPGS